MKRVYEQVTAEVFKVHETIAKMVRDGWTIAHYTVSHSHPQHPTLHHFIFEKFVKEDGGER